MGFKKNTYVELIEIVRRVQKDLEEGTERTDTYLHWALEAHKDWHLHLGKEVKTVILPVTDWKAIELPNDYIDWTKVGIQNGDQIQTFVNDPNMALNFDKEERTGDRLPNKNQQITDISYAEDGIVTPYGWYFYNLVDEKGADGQRVFGLAHKDNYLGYFRVNTERGEIQFRTQVSGLKNVYLEYIADGYNPCKNTLVHPEAVSLYKLYIHWMREKYKPNPTKWVVDNAKQDYWEEFDRVQFLMWDLTVEDILDVSWNAYSQVPIN